MATLDGTRTANTTRPAPDACLALFTSTSPSYRRMELNTAVASSQQLRACVLVAVLLVVGALVMRGASSAYSGVSSLASLRSAGAAKRLGGGGLDDTERLLGSSRLDSNGDEEPFLVSSEEQAVSRLAAANEAALHDRDAIMDKLNRARVAATIDDAQAGTGAGSDGKGSTAPALLAPPLVKPKEDKAVAGDGGDGVSEEEIQDLATDVHLLADIDDLQRRDRDEAIRPMEHAVDNDEEGVLALPMLPAGEDPAN